MKIMPNNKIVLYKEHVNLYTQNKTTLKEEIILRL